MSRYERVARTLCDPFRLDAAGFGRDLHRLRDRILHREQFRARKLLEVGSGQVREIAHQDLLVPQREERAHDRHAERSADLDQRIVHRGAHARLSRTEGAHYRVHRGRHRDRHADAERPEANRGLPAGSCFDPLHGQNQTQRDHPEPERDGAPRADAVGKRGRGPCEEHHTQRQGHDRDARLHRGAALHVLEELRNQEEASEQNECDEDERHIGGGEVHVPKQIEVEDAGRAPALPGHEGDRGCESTEPAQDDAIVQQLRGVDRRFDDRVEQGADRDDREQHAQ